MGFELDMMLAPSQLEMPSHQEKGMTTSITLDSSILASLSLYLPFFIAILSLGTTLARIATLPLDCAIVTRPGQGLCCLKSTKPFPIFALMFLHFYFKDNKKHKNGVLQTKVRSATFLFWVD